MKIVLRIVGTLSGLDTIAALARLFGKLSRGHSDPALIARSVVPNVRGPDHLPVLFPAGVSKVYVERLLTRTG